MSAVLDAQLLAEVFVTLFVIMDPPGTVPVFLGLTGTMTARGRNRAARQAILVAFGVIVTFALFGQQVLDYMNISLLAGPGAIVATMVFVEHAETSAQWVSIALGVVAVHLCLWLSMRFAGLIHRVLKDSGTTLVTRIAGLLLAAIAVQLMADAVRAFIAGG